MRDPKRIRKICKLLEVVWVKYSDQRLGQLLENYVFGHHEDGCIFYQEDDITIQKLKEHIQQWI